MSETHVAYDGQADAIIKELRRTANQEGGIGALAHATGFSRETMYRTLGPRGNPKLKTLLLILDALGLQLTIRKPSEA